MTGRNGVVRIIGKLSTADDMPPPGTNASAGRNRDDVAVLVNDALVACEGAVAHVLDGVVARRGPDALELALVSAVDAHLLEDGVGGPEAEEREERAARELHNGKLLLEAQACSLVVDGEQHSRRN